MLELFQQRTKLLASFVFILTAATASCASARSLYSYFLFFPSKEVTHKPDKIDDVPRLDVSIPVGKHTLNGWFFKRSDSPYVMLVNHGNGGNMSHMARIANYGLEAGVSVLVYDYRGYGESKGHPSVKSICADGDAAYDFLISRAYSAEQIILYGQSLGCAVACHIAEHHQVGGMILQSGFSSLRMVASEQYPSWKRAVPFVVPDVLNNAKILSKINTPVLIIHGDKDKVVPFDNATKLYESAIGPKQLIVCKDAGHNLRETPDQLKNAVKAFVEKYCIGQVKSAGAADSAAKSNEQ